jgi:hypothetical protein
MSNAKSAKLEGNAGCDRQLHEYVPCSVRSRPGELQQDRMSDARRFTSGSYCSIVLAFGVIGRPQAPPARRERPTPKAASPLRTHAT